MKPHPRIRKTVKWGGLALTVVLVVVWVASWPVSGSWMLVYVASNGAHVGASRGMLAMGYEPLASVAFPNGGFVAERHHDPLYWWVRFERHGNSWAFELPIWLVLSATMIATGAAWRLDVLARRRAIGGLNRCPRCGYDRTGLVGGAGAVCPECGAGAPGGAA